MTEEERESVTKKLAYAVSILCDGMDASLIPEVGMNIVYALPDARDPSEVAGIEGRIVRVKDRIRPVGEVAFGGSDHIARIVLTSMRFDPEVRSAANIRFSEEVVSALRDQVSEVTSFDRMNEPKGVNSMDWGVASCCSEDEVPDVIYDHGSIGKEPMIRILGEDPVEVAHNIIMLSGRIRNTYP